MDPALSQLIRSTAATTGVAGVKYVQLYGAKTQFTIPNSKLHEFLGEYCRLAYEDELAAMEEGGEQHSLCIAEVVKDRKTIPVMGVFNFRFHYTEGLDVNSLYTQRTIFLIAHCYQTVIEEQLNLGGRGAEFLCFIFNSTPIMENDNVLVQLKFQFPYCHVDQNYFKTRFRARLEQVLRLNKVLNTFELQSPIGDWPTILEEVPEFVPLYRSSPSLLTPPLSVAKICGHITKEMLDEEEDVPEYDETNLDTIFSVNRFSLIVRGICSKDLIDEEQSPLWWLPVYLLMDFWSLVEVFPKDVVEVDKKPGLMNRDPELLDTATDLQIATEMLGMMADKRFLEENYRRDIGKVIYNITKGSPEGLAIWVGALKAHGADQTAIRNCDFLYNGFESGKRGNFLTVKTLAWYARQDSPEDYANWHNAWMAKSLVGALTLDDDDVAKLLYRYFWLDYICTGMAGIGIWYHFDGHRLKYLDEAVDLVKGIKDDFIMMLEKYRVAVVSKYDLSEQEKKIREETNLKVTALIKRLKSERNKRNYIRSARSCFHVEDFESMKDKIHAVGCENCVIEICGDKAIPRPGKPEDYITKSTRIAYPFHYTADHPNVKRVLKWNRQTFPDEELCHFSLKDAASFLQPGNGEKLLRVATGDGNNSKSMYNTLYQETLGMYSVSLPMEAIASSKKGSGPSPELAQTDGALHGDLAEPEETDELRGGVIKRLTGMDRIFARMCNQNGSGFELRCKLVLMCNHIPDIPNVDKAVKNRFLIIPYLSTWVEDAPESEEEQFKQRLFPLDPDFKHQIPSMAPAFLWIMVQYFPYYKHEGLKRPKIVQDYIRRHWEDNDPYLLFMTENVNPAYKVDAKDPVKGDDRVKDLEDPIEKKEIDMNESFTATDLYNNSFKRWFQNSYPKRQIPSQARFKEEMCKSDRLGPQTKMRWYGFRYRSMIATM
jgi:phage/plasmid-associated DNA primase